jgi:methyl-accepting chemotaxis protein
MVKGYKDWGIFSKIMSLSVVTWLLLVLATTFVLEPYIRGLIMEEKKDTVRFLVEDASTILDTYQ